MVLLPALPLVLLPALRLLLRPSEARLPVQRLLLSLPMMLLALPALLLALPAPEPVAEPAPRAPVAAAP